MGSSNSELKWDNFKNPRNIYSEYSDINKSMRISSLYEYSLRNFYITFLRPEASISDSGNKFLSAVYKDADTKTTNDYTGIFKGKNVIFLQLEGLDSWMFNETDTPNLYSFLDNSVNFSDRYSIYTGGGSTFNSEFAVNTGLTTPVSFSKNVYSFSDNTFDCSLAKLMKRQGYSVNAFHMNSSEFYSRGINYKSWGYDNYYGLLNIKKYKTEDYKLDRELINNSTFYDKMLKQKGNFMNYVITYSPHKPFDSTKEVTKLILEKNTKIKKSPN